MTDESRGNSPPQPVRCAIYTRKSSEEGLEQEFNSLDAQRDVAEAFIASQRHEGWICLPQHYDDGGFTGGNMDRPALRQLLEDIGAGKIDCVVIYKLDRLTRSLLDFAQIMQTFERHGVAFASVTQQFNSQTSMGRLVLHVLLSFAQFEREMISERTRDKIAATRRKGKGDGRPRLGYDAVNGKLVVNPEEAQRVREIFALYLREQSLTATMRELRRRGWANKSWISLGGKRYGGGPLDTIRLKGLLSNVTYIGHVRYKDETYPGEHPAIVDPGIFAEAQQAIQRHDAYWKNRPTGKSHPLLRGLLHCSACHCGMIWGSTARKARRYAYYVCHQATRRGWCSCPVPSVSADAIEPFVVEQVARVSDVPVVVHEVCRLSWQTFIAQRGSRTSDHIAARNGGALQKARMKELWARFPRHWSLLSNGDRCRLLAQLIERIDYHGSLQKLSITFRPAGILTLIEHLGQ